MHAGGDSDAADVFDFVDEFLTDREKGRDLALAHYLARYARCQDAVAREYLALKTPTTDAARSSAPAADSAAAEARIGPYRLLSEIGRGGQGTVFLAEDSRIARKVALKVLASRFELVSEDRRRRFRREAEVIARLEHPGICGIYDADIEGDAPYIAMRHVDGRSLAQILADARAATPAPAQEPDVPESDVTTTWPPRSSLDIRRVLLLFERVARALHAAHEAGVVHRDVKPGNVMVARDGKPVLLDFGLARDEQADVATLTQSGDVFGTPAYMSPEQLAGGTPLDRRTDVYSLAASLYEALTLVRPFEAPSRIELYRRIREEQVPDPKKHNPRLGEDVRVVLETALERERERRYATALEFAEDLRRIREYEPIRARPAGVVLRFSRWTRRHPVLAVSTIGTILALSTGLALALHLIAKRDEALGYALGRHLAERCVALVSEDPALALAVGVEAAEKEIREGGSTTGANYLTRSALFDALEACWLERVFSVEPARLATDAALDAEGRLLVLATDTSLARIFDLGTGSAVRDLVAPEGGVARVFFTRDGTQVVVAGKNGKIRIFDVASGTLFRELDAGEALVAADLAPEGDRMVTVGASGGSAVFDLRAGERRSLHDGGGRQIEWAAFLPRDATKLLTRDSSGNAALLDATTGRSVLAYDTGSIPVVACAFDPAADRVALACKDGRVCIHDLVGGGPVGPVLTLGARAGFLTFSRDGTKLFVGTHQDQVGEALLFDLASGERHSLTGHAGRRVVHAAFSPDGKVLATASFDATVRVWDAVTGTQLRVFVGRTRPVSVAWTPDSRRLVTLSNDWANVWFTRNRPDVLDLAGHAGPVVRARFAPDGRSVLTASLDGTARLWSADITGERDPGTPLHVLHHGGPVIDACFDRRGERVLTTSADGTARVWSARTGESIGKPLAHPAPVISGTFDVEGTRVLTVCADGAVRVMDSSSVSTPIVLASTAGAFACAAFGSGGAIVATGGAGDAVGIFDARTGAHVRNLAFTHDKAFPPGVCAVAAAPDGVEIAAACNDEKVRFWDARTGEASRPDLVVFPVRSLSFAADGSKLLVTGQFGGGAAKVLHLGTARRTVQAEIAHTRGSSILGGALSADGSLVLTFAKDGTAHVWDATSGRPVAHRAARDAMILDAAFDGASSNPRVVVARDDGTVSIWPVDPLPAARARMPRPMTPLEKERERRLALPLRYD